MQQQTNTQTSQTIQILEATTSQVIQRLEAQMGYVTSHISWVWEWRCAYMYIRTLLNTTRLKAVMDMKLSELRS
jgi:hypothetical protein